ncbi:hypothetical protein EWM64_g59 [Hericium alpestre]|uniref:Protein EFR3 n=1 Tax=Hericium alpestre TaxID=135208 RepID=A0A4Z0ABG2_9AGAM|nr:hypothetical protein EWM64_g59 [Hericium alpestre]
MHLPFTPNHVQLISACYPSSAALLTAGPEYRPNAQELSRLTYYASNRPGKINKLGSELEKRIRGECKKAQAGNARARASLLISLSIMRALATECRRDISLLTRSLLASIDTVLAGLSTDLEVSAKVATLFTTFTTFTDGRLIGVDSHATKDYMSILDRFSQMSAITSKSSDHEFRNRTRLVGLAALSGAVTSEALYGSNSFRIQASKIVSALVINVHDVDLSTLENESATLKEKTSSPYLAEFRTRPTVERRAASIHLHKDGDKGPSSVDVTNACLRIFSTLLDHSNGAQVADVVHAALDSLDDWKGWEKSGHCCWLARKMTDWSQYQYRYAVPTRLVERLQENQDAPVTRPLHHALASMITTVFDSPTTVVNLSTSDIISTFITIVLRRTASDPDDSLLPSLTACIASLGTHVYYSDQIHDLASELISRLITVEANGVPGRERDANDRSRVQAVRCLLASLVGLIQAADRHEGGKPEEHRGREEHRRSEETSRAVTSTFIASEDPQKPVRVSIEHADDTGRPSNRTKLAPEIWQDTLHILCDENYAVRAEYVTALIFYLETEISRRGEYTDHDGIRRPRPLAEGPLQQASNMIAMLYGDASTRFLHAAHVYFYILATASSLGTSTVSSSPARSMIGDVTGSADASGAVYTAAEPGSSLGGERRDSPTYSQHNRRSMSIPARVRKQSAIQQMLTQLPSELSLSIATTSDYRNILAILQTIHEHLPVRGLLTGVPFLLRLASMVRNTSTHPDELARVLILREVIVRICLCIGKKWDCQDVVSLAEQSLSSMLIPSYLPASPKREPGTLNPPEEPIPLLPVDLVQSTWLGIDIDSVILALVKNSNINNATGMDEETLHGRLTTEWSAETALKDSVEPQPAHDPLRGDGASQRLKLAPALMHIENMSLQSLTRPTRAVGVTDLRDALEGRSSMSNPALVNAAPSISTLEHISTVHGDATSNRLVPVRSRPEKPKISGNPSEVRDVLNKLRIGKQSGNNNLLKASFPALQRRESQYVLP